MEIRINWDWNGNLIPTRLAILWGRYVEFHIFPYSYAEYLQLMQQPAGRASYLAYLQKGGLPELYNLPTVESEKQYVASVKDTILLRDIVKRKPVRDVRLLDDIFIYLIMNFTTALGWRATRCAVAPILFRISIHETTFTE